MNYQLNQNPNSNYGPYAMQGVTSDTGYTTSTAPPINRQYMQAPQQPQQYAQAPQQPQQYAQAPQQYAQAPQQYAQAPQQYAQAPQQYAQAPQQYMQQQPQQSQQTQQTQPLTISQPDAETSSFKHIINIISCLIMISTLIMCILYLINGSFSQALSMVCWIIILYMIYSYMNPTVPGPIKIEGLQLNIPVKA